MFKKQQGERAFPPLDVNLNMQPQPNVTQKQAPNVVDANCIRPFYNISKARAQQYDAIEMRFNRRYRSTIQYIPVPDICYNVTTETAVLRVRIAAGILPQSDWPQMFESFPVVYVRKGKMYYAGTRWADGGESGVSGNKKGGGGSGRINATNMETVAHNMDMLQLAHLNQIVYHICNKIGCITKIAPGESDWCRVALLPDKREYMKAVWKETTCENVKFQDEITSTEKELLAKLLKEENWLSAHVCSAKEGCFDVQFAVDPYTESFAQEGGDTPLTRDVVVWPARLPRGSDQFTDDEGEEVLPPKETPPPPFRGGSSGSPISVPINETRVVVAYVEGDSEDAGMGAVQSADRVNTLLIGSF